jgi:hypothetical protein
MDYYVPHKQAVTTFGNLSLFWLSVARGRRIVLMCVVLRSN